MSAGEYARNWLSCCCFLWSRNAAGGGLTTLPQLFQSRSLYSSEKGKLRHYIKTSSCKAKGRRFQQRVRDDLRAIGREHGLEDADVESRGMGQAGEDVILSPAYRKLLNLDIECKNVERLDVGKTFFDHYEKYKNRPSLKLVTHNKNRSEALVTLLWTDFLQLLRRLLPDVNQPAK